MMKSEQTIVDKVTDYFGSCYKAANAMDVHHQQYYSWRDRGYFPFKWGKPIETLTNGAIPALEIWEEAGKRAK